MDRSLEDETLSLRGSQKSNSVQEEIEERGRGEGEGDREGQAFADNKSDAWLAVTEGGWMKTV